MSTTTDLTELQRKLWSAADELRANSTLTAAQYRDPVPSTIFEAFKTSTSGTYALFMLRSCSEALASAEQKQT